MADLGLSPSLAAQAQTLPTIGPAPRRRSSVHSERSVATSAAADLDEMVDRLMDSTIGRYQVVAHHPQELQSFLAVCRDDVRDLLLEAVASQDKDAPADPDSAVFGGEEAEAAPPLSAATKRTAAQALKRENVALKAAEMFLRTVSSEAIQEAQLKGKQVETLSGLVRRRDGLLTDQRLAYMRELQHLRAMIRQYREKGKCTLQDASFYNWDTDTPHDAIAKERDDIRAEVAAEERSRFDRELEAADTRHRDVVEDLRLQLAALDKELLRATVRTQTADAETGTAPPPLTTADDTQTDLTAEDVVYALARCRSPGADRALSSSMSDSHSDTEASTVAAVAGDGLSPRGSEKRGGRRKKPKPSPRPKRGKAPKPPVEEAEVEEHVGPIGRSARRTTLVPSEGGVDDNGTGTDGNSPDGAGGGAGDGGSPRKGDDRHGAPGTPGKGRTPRPLEPMDDDEAMIEEARLRASALLDAPPASTPTAPSPTATPRPGERSPTRPQTSPTRPHTSPGRLRPGTGPGIRAAHSQSLENLRAFKSPRLKKAEPSKPEPVVADAAADPEEVIVLRAELQRHRELLAAAHSELARLDRSQMRVVTMDAGLEESALPTTAPPPLPGARGSSMSPRLTKQLGTPTRRGGPTPATVPESPQATPLRSSRTETDGSRSARSRPGSAAARPVTVPILPLAAPSEPDTPVEPQPMAAPPTPHLGIDPSVVEDLKATLARTEAALETQRRQHDALRTESTKWYAVYQREPGGSYIADPAVVAEMGRAVHAAEEAEGEYRQLGWSLMALGTRRSAALTLMRKACSEAEENGDAIALRRSQLALDATAQMWWSRQQRFRQQRQEMRHRANCLWDEVLYFARSATHVKPETGPDGAALSGTPRTPRYYAHTTDAAVQEELVSPRAIKTPFGPQGPQLYPPSPRNRQHELQRVMRLFSAKSHGGYAMGADFESPRRHTLPLRQPMAKDFVSPTKSPSPVRASTPAAPLASGMLSRPSSGSSRMTGGDYVQRLRSAAASRPSSASGGPPPAPPRPASAASTTGNVGGRGFGAAGRPWSAKSAASSSTPQLLHHGTPPSAPPVPGVSDTRPRPQTPMDQRKAGMMRLLRQDQRQGAVDRQRCADDIRVARKARELHQQQMAGSPSSGFYQQRLVGRYEEALSP